MITVLCSLTKLHHQPSNEHDWDKTYHHPGIPAVRQGRLCVMTYKIKDKLSMKWNNRTLEKLIISIMNTRRNSLYLHISANTIFFSFSTQDACPTLCYDRRKLNEKASEKPFMKFLQNDLDLENSYYMVRSKSSIHGDILVKIATQNICYLGFIP